MSSNGEIRVLHLITRFKQGGAEKTTVNTLRYLQEADIEYVLRLGFGDEYDKGQVGKVQNEGIDTVCFNWVRHYNPITAVLAVFEIRKYLVDEEIDILHTHSTEAGIIGRWAGALANIPVILHEIHGDPITEDRNSALNYFIWITEWLSAIFTTRIIAKSKRIRERYLNRNIGNAGQYELIYHGVDTSEFQEAASRHGGSYLSKDKARLLFVGRLADGKGLFDLLEAVARIDKADFELNIAGEGRLEAELRNEISRLDLEDTVNLLGYRDDIPKLMAQSDVLVLPSYREGTPRVITEALAAGTPVVATNIAGIPEQVDDGKTGYLVEPGDINALKARLQILLEDDNLIQKFGNRAINRVEKFDVKTAQCRYQRLYRKLAQR